MSDLFKMRSGVLRELKNVHRLLRNMERNVRSNNPIAIQKAYMFLVALTYHLDEGQLAPESIQYNLELTRALQQVGDL